MITTPPAAPAVYIVACGRDKTRTPAAARDLYTSSHFRWVLRAVERQAAVARTVGTPTTVRILSARYGLVDPDHILPPYDTTIGGADVIPAELITRQLEQLAVGDRLDVTAFLPRAYLLLLQHAASAHHGLDVGVDVVIHDAYAQAPGIGYQRHVIANLAPVGAGGVRRPVRSPSSTSSRRRSRATVQHGAAATLD